MTCIIKCIRYWIERNIICSNRHNLFKMRTAELMPASRKWANNWCVHDDAFIYSDNETKQLLLSSQNKFHLVNMKTIHSALIFLSVVQRTFAASPLRTISRGSTSTTSNIEESNQHHRGLMKVMKVKMGTMEMRIMVSNIIFGFLHWTTWRSSKHVEASSHIFSLLLPGWNDSWYSWWSG